MKNDKANFKNKTWDVYTQLLRYPNQFIPILFERMEDALKSSHYSNVFLFVCQALSAESDESYL